MYKSRLHKVTFLICSVLCAFALTACAAPEVQETVQEQQGGFIKIAPGAYDSADTALVIAKQEKQKKITFLNLEKKRNYTLNYDGTTKFMDKYGTQISVSQLQEGEMVDLQFLKDEKLLSNLTVSSDIWTLNDVSKFELDPASGRMKIMNENYTLDETTVVLSDGELVEFLDINAQDMLQIKGIDHKIYSITIQKGHGYLRLDNAEYFYGGWIEVGQKIIQKIEEDMLLVIPEGDYEVFLSHNGIAGTKEVKIKRNQETLLDVGDLKKEDLIKYGNLIVTVDPAEAEVSIDGKVVDTGRIIKASYGLHQIMAKAEGYDTVIQYIRVTEDNANVAITLDEETVHSVSENSAATSTNSNTTTNGSTNNNSSTDGNTSDNNSGNTVSGNNSASSSNNTTSENSTSSNTGTKGYKVSIEAPAGAEVYVDGNYIGIIPISFPKKEGTHEVIVRKSGYQTRSYTIQVDDTNEDIGYSFSELTPIVQDVQEPQNVQEPQDVKESQDVQEPQDAQESQNVQEPQDAQELQNVQEPQDVQEVRNVSGNSL